jgi:uncharacterized protein (TIGR00251 family)
MTTSKSGKRAAKKAEKNAKNRTKNDVERAAESKHENSDETATTDAAGMPGQHPAFAWDGDTLVLYILGKPGDKHDAIGKIHGNQLKVSVTAAPRSGKATDHMVRFLAREFGITTRDIEVVSGRTNVNKKLRIKAPQRLPAVLGPVHGPVHAFMPETMPSLESK